MSTDHQQNLIILTEHILHLSEKQQKAVDQITGANRSIADPARNVSETHGVVCEATHRAVQAVETARRTAGGALLKVSTELREELVSAASHYENTDGSAGAKLDRCEV